MIDVYLYVNGYFFKKHTLIKYFDELPIIKYPMWNKEKRAFGEDVPLVEYVDFECTKFEPNLWIGRLNNPNYIICTQDGINSFIGHINIIEDNLKIKSNLLRRFLLTDEKPIEFIHKPLKRVDLLDIEK